MGAKNKGKQWTNEEDILLTELRDEHISISLIATFLGRTQAGIVSRIDILFLERPLKEYIVYKGENFLASGTMKECSSRTGIAEKTLRHYATPSGRKRQEIKKNAKNRFTVSKVRDVNDGGDPLD